MRRLEPKGARRLGELTWPETDAGARVLAVPLGATEQHGPHLPIGTDTLIASALAERLAARRADILVAPPLPFGSSGEHAGFPGTISIGQQALELVVTELVRSTDDFAGVVLVSGHGGNAGPLKRAADLLTYEGRKVLVWSPSREALAGAGSNTSRRDAGSDTSRRDAGAGRWDVHAGYVETSMLLALDAPGVHVERAEAGNTKPIADLAEKLVSEGVRGVSPNGVLGDPAGASAAVGNEILDALTDDLAARVNAWKT